MKDRTHQEDYLNLFFVEVFNKILIAEETALSKCDFPNLSVKEFHVLEAVGLLSKEKHNTMTAISKKIGITIGALTTAVNGLINKGYLTRKRVEKDRRVVKVYLSELGKSANAMHEKFHKDMIAGILGTINVTEMNTLIFSLEQLTAYFSQYLKHIK